MEPTTTKDSFIHQDNLGNVIAITDKDGKIINRRSYTPFGEIRYLLYKEAVQKGQNLSTIDALKFSTTNRAFTGHESIEGTDLIHMNGRVYDPTIGRFLSADPFIQASYDTQSYNRYSYVKNNPLNYTDPSGYNWFKKQWNKWIKPVLAIAVAAVITFYTAGAGGAALGAAWGSFFSGVGGAMAAGALAGAAGGAIMTGTLSGTLKGAMWGAIGAGIAQQIGHGASFFQSARNGMNGVGKHLLHGLSRAAISKAQGGTWRGGFWSGFAASAFSPGTTIGGDGATGFTARTSIAAVVGGTASELGGGKFANGAVSGAFVHMFNAEMEKITMEKMNLTTLEVIGNELSRIQKMDQETFENEITFGVKYTSKENFQDAQRDVIISLTHLLNVNSSAIGINYYNNMARWTFRNFPKLSYTLFGYQPNQYEVKYFCIPGNTCRSIGVYREKN